MKKYLTILFLFLFSSCASVATNVTAIKNPEAQQVKLKKILVVAFIPDLDFKITTEKNVAIELTSLGIEAIPSVQLLPPVKKYSAEDFLKTIKQNKIDGVLMIEIEDIHNEKIYIPETSYSSGEADFYGNSIYFQSSTSEFGGFTISKPVAKFVVKLFDTKTGKLVWMGVVKCRGNGFASYNDLTQALGEELVKNLKQYF